MEDVAQGLFGCLHTGAQGWGLCSPATGEPQRRDTGGRVSPGGRGGGGGREERFVSAGGGFVSVRGVDLEFEAHWRPLSILGFRGGGRSAEGGGGVGREGRR